MRTDPLSRSEDVQIQTVLAGGCSLRITRLDTAGTETHQKTVASFTVFLYRGVRQDSGEATLPGLSSVPSSCPISKLSCFKAK